MELRQLEYFIAVAECQSFSRAAEKLYISQSTISYQIAELEKELGAELFIRDKRSVTLSWSGQRLIEPVKNVLDNVLEIRRLARRQIDGEKYTGRLQFYFEDGELNMESTKIPRILGEYISSHPKTYFSMFQKDTETCYELLLNDTIDLAVISLYDNETVPAGLKSKTIFSDRLVVVIPDIPQNEGIHTLKEVCAKFEIAFFHNMPKHKNRIFKYLKKQQLFPEIHGVDTIELGLSYLYSNQIAMILPEYYLKVYSNHRFKVIELEPGTIEINCLAVWNKNRKNPELQEALKMLDCVSAYETPENP